MQVITEFLKEEHSDFQFVEPDNYRVNTAECIIQTWKNHFIAGMCSTDHDFPIKLWDKLIPQSEMKLHLLHTLRVDHTKSTYKALECPFKFDKYLLASPGTKSII